MAVLYHVLWFFDHLKASNVLFWTWFSLFRPYRNEWSRWFSHTRVNISPEITKNRVYSKECTFILTIRLFPTHINSSLDYTGKSLLHHIWHRSKASFSINFSSLSLGWMHCMRLLKFVYVQIIAELMKAKSEHFLQYCNISLSESNYTYFRVIRTSLLFRKGRETLFVTLFSNGSLATYVSSSLRVSLIES